MTIDREGERTSDQRQRRREDQLPSTEKARGPVTNAREGERTSDLRQRRREDQRALLRRWDPQRESNQRKKAGARYGKQEQGKFLRHVLTFGGPFWV